MSTVQINLLPDARKDKLRDQSNRQLAVSVASVAIAASVISLVLLVLFTQAQRLQISLLSKSIKDKNTQIQQDVPQAQEIATTQQHLSSLQSLSTNKVAMSKFFTVLSSVSNNDVTISSITLDTANKLTVSGQALSYSSASKLAQAMQASNITIGSNPSPSNQPDFSNVLLNALSGEQGKVSFTITATVAPGVTK